MAQRKPYNPNTAYGRKKLREEAARNYANMPPEQRRERDTWGCLIMIIIAIVFGGCIYLIGGEKALMKWFSR
jgi:hypothetical protein